MDVRPNKDQVMVGTAALAGTVAALAAVGTAIHALDPHVILHAKGGPALVYTVKGPDGTPVRVLRQGGVYQSATYLDDRHNDLVFEYYRGFDRIFDVRPQSVDLLVLGGGGFAYPKHVLSKRPYVRMDVVEVDPAITRAASRYFFLAELLTNPTVREGFNIFSTDARSYLETCERRYDAIVNDCFCGREPVRELATLQAAQLVKEHLLPDGLYLTNVVSANDGHDVYFLADVVTTLSEVFSQVHVVSCAEEYAGEDNYLVIATDADGLFMDELPLEGLGGDVLRDQDL